MGTYLMSGFSVKVRSSFVCEVFIHDTEDTGELLGVLSESAPPNQPYKCL